MTGNFYKDLCEAFTAANIPLKKLKNSVLKFFIEKYTDRKVPDESTLRKIYVPKCYSDVMQSIKTNIGNNYVWVSAEETTDAMGRNVVQVVVGILHPSINYTPYVIKC